jgi:hypothetical protein
VISGHETKMEKGTCSAFATVLSKVYPRCGCEHVGWVLSFMPATLEGNVSRGGANGECGTHET